LLNTVFLNASPGAGTFEQPRMPKTRFGHLLPPHRRRAEANLEAPIVSIPMQYTKKPLFRSEEPRF
jgi:hypothetical protein